MSVIFWFLLIYGFDEPLTAGLTVLAALIHELGHILYIYTVLGSEITLRGVLNGMRLRKGRRLSYKEEILSYASGPLANLLACLIALPFLAGRREYALLFIALNAATAISNLMPLREYDGYGILVAVLGMHGIGTRGLGALSFFIKCAATFVALYLMERIGEGYWLFGVFFFSLLGEMKDSAFLKKL